VKPTLDVLLLSRYASRGASSRIRMYQYVPALADAGITVTPAPLLAGEDLSRRQATGRYPWRRLWTAIRGRLAAVGTRRRYDVLWIEYELMPFLPAVIEHLLLRGGPSTTTPCSTATIGTRPRSSARCSAPRSIG